MTSDRQSRTFENDKDQHMTATSQQTGLVNTLPEPIPTNRIIELNQPKADLHTHRRYEWNGWTFDVPPAVFLPGATSRMIHERILDGTIAVEGRRYAAMGVGLGVEAVVAGLRGAREIYAIDVHPESVRATERHYARIVGPRPGTTLLPLVGDVFDTLPEGVRLDVITFNPPAVSAAVSDDPDVVRNVCVGSDLLAAFFEQAADRGLLAEDGEIFVVASNTADLREIVRHAMERGFHVEVHHRHAWHDEVRTYIFRVTREAGR